MALIFENLVELVGQHVALYRTARRALPYSSTCLTGTKVQCLCLWNDSRRFEEGGLGRWLKERQVLGVEE